MRCTHIEAGAWATLFVCALLAGPAGAATISEVLATAKASTPAYIELDVLGVGPFDLVVLDGSPSTSRNRRIKAVVTIDAPGARLVVVHEGAWPGIPVITTAYIRVDDLDLTVRSGHVARRLIAFDGVTGWRVGDEAPPLDTWHNAGSGVPTFDPLGIVTYQMGSVVTTGALGEPVVTLAPADGLSRHRGDLSYVGAFSSGPIDDALAFTQGVGGLNPGMTNTAATAPEPAALPLLLAGAIGLTNRVGRR